MVNRTLAPATSLHAQPLMSSMTYYDPAALAPVGTEAVVPTPPVLDAPAASYGLHPARRRALS